MEQVILSKSTAAQIIDRSSKHIDRLINRGDLTAVIEGREIRITGESLRAYVDKLPRVKAKEARQ